MAESIAWPLPTEPSFDLITDYQALCDARLDVLDAYDDNADPVTVAEQAVRDTYADVLLRAIEWLEDWALANLGVILLDG